MSDAGGLKTFGDIIPGIQYVERPGAYAFLFNVRQELAVIKTSYGFFLPGGGLDPGEDEVTGLARELREEIGYILTDSTFVIKAAQYHWSEHYQSYFKKIGHFFEVEAQAPAQDTWAPGHSLIWIPRDLAARELSQEFQRWAVQYAIPN